jgi:hypothetical protein
MALSNEDHKDVKGALGKAMANKISKVTRDSSMKAKYGGHGQGHFTPNGGWIGKNVNKKSSSTPESRSGFESKDRS